VLCLGGGGVRGAFLLVSFGFVLVFVPLWFAIEGEVEV
jgi:hypothetical protein